MKESVAMLHWVFFMCDERRNFLSNVAKGIDRTMFFVLCIYLSKYERVTEVQREIALGFLRIRMFRYSSITLFLSVW